MSNPFRSVHGANIAIVDFQRHTSLQNTVIDAGMYQISGMLQLVERQIGRNDQRLPASVSTVYDIENLFQRILGVALHAQVIDNQQAVGVQAVDEFVSVG